MVLEKQILMFLNIAHNSVKQCMSEVFQRGGFNLTPEQFLVMDTLWDEGVLTQQQIADITMRDKNSIVKLIDGLENRKLVRRVSNPKDRRQNLIEVTPYSRKIKDAVTELSLEAVATIVGDIPREDLESFVRTLARMERNMNPKSDLEALARKYPTKRSEMGRLYDLLMKDYRLKEGLNACINCGTCTAICPAAEFYRYDPRRIVDIVQSKDDEEIEKLLKSDTIWYCGECMSCVTRCPRKNAPGLIIMALRSLSIDLGYFIESEKGRQQCLLVKDLCANILDYGYCVYPRRFDYAGHPEAGKVWEWEEKHLDDVFERLGGNLDGEGPGAMRRIPQEDLDQLKRIFDETGATERMEKVREAGLRKAAEMGLTEDEFMAKIYTDSDPKHLNQ